MKQEFLQFSDLYIKNEYQEQLNDLNVIFLEGETHLLWGNDNTPRIFADLFHGNSKILSGNIIMNGRKIEKCNRQTFEAGGIFLVDSQVELMDSLTLAENLFLLKNNSLKKIRLNQKALLIRTKELMEQYELELDVSGRVENLRAIEKVWFQLVRLADRKAKMLVLSGVTPICSRQDLRKLLSLLNKIREKGISLLIFDSHPEYFWELADDFYLMRGGCMIRKFWDKERFDRYWYSAMESETEEREKNAGIADDNSSCRFIWQNQKGEEISFEFDPGEIVYIRTNGWEQQQEIRKNLLGENGHKSKFESGSQKLMYDDCRILAENRIGFWGKEPLKSEYFSNLSVRDNIMLPSVKKISRFGFYQRGERFIFHDKDFCPELDEIEKSSGMTDASVFMILCYRWRLFHPKILIVHNILSRADLEMRKWISEMLLDMAKRGTAVILLEAFEEDALPLADRIVLPDSKWV